MATTIIAWKAGKGVGKVEIPKGPLEATGMVYGDKSLRISVSVS